VLVLLAAGMWYRRHQRAVRQEALNAALAIYNAPWARPAILPARLPERGREEQGGAEGFQRSGGPLFGIRRSSHCHLLPGHDGGGPRRSGGSRETPATGRRIPPSPVRFARQVALADIYRAQGKIAEGEKLLRSLIEKPTDFVSREHATILLAELIKDSRPEEARKLLEPLRTSRSVISRHSLTVLAELPQK
jgi:hypothetical protein